MTIPINNANVFSANNEYSCHSLLLVRGNGAMDLNTYSCILNNSPRGQGHLLDLFGHPSGAYRKGGFWMPDFWIISPSQHNKDAIPVDPYGEWPFKIPSERI